MGDLLLISRKGLGVSRHTFGAMSLPLCALALLNFALETLYISSRPWSARGAGVGMTLIVLGMAFTLTVLYAQIVTSLSRMAVSLSARRQPYKASLFWAQRRVTVGVSYLMVSFDFPRPLCEL